MGLNLFSFKRFVNSILPNWKMFFFSAPWLSPSRQYDNIGPCAICGDETSHLHGCVYCFKNVHIFCGISLEEENIEDYFVALIVRSCFLHHPHIWNCPELSFHMQWNGSQRFLGRNVMGLYHIVLAPFPS